MTTIHRYLEETAYSVSISKTIIHSAESSHRMMFSIDTTHAKKYLSLCFKHIWTCAYDFVDRTG